MKKGATKHNKEDLARPEFDGLWTKKHKDYKVMEAYGVMDGAA